MAKYWYMLEGFNYQREEHERGLKGMGGAYPWGSWYGSLPPVDPKYGAAPYFGQSFHGNRSGYWGDLVYTHQYYPLLNDGKKWFQTGCWMKLNDATGGNRPVGASPFRITTQQYPNWNEAGGPSWGINSSNAVYLWCAGGNSTGGSFTIPVGKWVWYEARIKWSATTNDAEFYFRADGQLIYSRTAFNSALNIGTGWNASSFYIQNSQTLWDGYYDGMYAMFADSDTDLEWYDESAIEILKANAAGTDNDFGISGAPNIVDAVKQAPYSDSEYGTANADSQRQSWTFAGLDVSRARTIHGVKAVFRVRKQTAGQARAVPYCKIGGTRYYASNGPEMINYDFATVEYIWPINPATSLAWTESDLSTAEFGLEIRTS